MKGKMKGFAVCALACAMTAAAGAMLPAKALAADAAEAEGTQAVYTAEEEGRALFSYLKLTIEGSDGEVRAVAKNMFTFLPGTIEVQVELYSSVEYQESYTDMQVERRMYIGDLNQGKSLVASASTDGEQRFWTARMIYEIDTAGKEERIVGPWLFDADGNRIESWEQ